MKESEKNVLATKKQDLSYFPMSKLRPSYENGILYDRFAPCEDADDYKLYLSIKSEGIREPLHISADGFILSGHRRYAAARYLSLVKVPVIISKDISSKLFFDSLANNLFEPLLNHILKKINSI